MPHENQRRMNKETGDQGTIDANEQERNVDAEVEGEEPQELGSHHCVILNTSFEALKSARDSTQAMESTNENIEAFTSREEDKNKQQGSELRGYQKFVTQITAPSHTTLQPGKDNTGHDQGKAWHWRCLQTRETRDKQTRSRGTRARRTETYPWLLLFKLRCGYELRLGNLIEKKKEARIQYQFCSTKTRHRDLCFTENKGQNVTGNSIKNKSQILQQQHWKLQKVNRRRNAFSFGIPKNYIWIKLKAFAQVTHWTEVSVPES